MTVSSHACAAQLKYARAETKPVGKAGKPREAEIRVALLVVSTGSLSAKRLLFAAWSSNWP